MVTASNVTNTLLMAKNIGLAKTLIEVAVCPSMFIRRTMKRVVIGLIIQKTRRNRKMNGCNICGEEVDVNNGGCAIMLAFCRNHSTTLTNVSFCRECYDLFISDPLTMLNENARLKLDFGKEETND